MLFVIQRALKSILFHGCKMSRYSFLLSFYPTFGKPWFTIREKEPKEGGKIMKSEFGASHLVWKKRKKKGRDNGSVLEMRDGLRTAICIDQALYERPVYRPEEGNQPCSAFASRTLVLRKIKGDGVDGALRCANKGFPRPLCVPATQYLPFLAFCVLIECTYAHYFSFLCL